nr:MAG TPA: hypothetical protein [Bacteriophage sp.]
MISLSIFNLFISCSSNSHTYSHFIIYGINSIMTSITSLYLHN